MSRRRHAALDTLLGWAGFGLGYVDEDTRPIDGHPQQVEATYPRVPPRPPQPVVRATAAVKNVGPDTGHWTDVLTISTERRLEAVHALEERIVARWEAWKERRLASIWPRRQSWTQDLREAATDLRAMAGRPLRWRRRRTALGNSPWSGPEGTLESSVAGPKAAPELVRGPIQRDRNWKMLQRVALDNQQLQDGGVGQRLVTHLPEDLRERQVFADVWEIADPGEHDPGAVPRQTNPPPTVERLNRLLSSDHTTPGDTTPGDTAPDEETAEHPQRRA